MTPRDLLKKYFGYDEFRPPQEEIINHVLSGRDALVIMPTGGGKSLCYQLPALMLDGLTLVISPLISLMKDQVDGLNAAGVPAACVNSTLSWAEISRIRSEAAGGRLKILFFAPERLASASAASFFRDLRVSLIAVDEAHCISEWGHDFRPDYRNLQPLRRQYPGVPVLALTATATETVRRDIGQQLGLGGGRIFVSSFDRPNLTYAVWPKQKTFIRLVALLRSLPGESAIVYCTSRNSTEKIAEKLRAAGISARAYHAGLAADDRNRVQEMFVHDDIDVVVATVAFGMGIDKPDVRLVAHYDLPKTIEGYYQETGRAGRDGLPSQCVLFYSYGDRQRLLHLFSQSGDWEERRKSLAKLDEVIRYCQTPKCRRHFLLGYFGQSYRRENCGGCDVCRPELQASPLPLSLKLSRASAATAGPATAGSRPVKAPPPHVSQLSNADLGLFERLRQLRKRLADERHVPAFVIFGDRTLKELAALRPKNRTEFAGIFGVGEKKLETFAEAFLEKINS